MASKDNIIAMLGDIDVDTFQGDEQARVQTIAAAQKLVRRLETPMDRAYGLMRNTWVWGVLQTFLDLDIWENWAKDEGEKSLQEVCDLAKQDVDVNLIRRLLRVLTSLDMVEEVGEERYKPNRFSLFLGRSGRLQPQAWTDFWRHYDMAGFLKETSYREPQNYEISAFSHGMPDKLSFFAKMASNPAYQESWGSWMAEWTKNKTPWTVFFDSGSLLDGADLDSPILVDIGGNVGGDLVRFHDKHPDLPGGALVLQDLPNALELAQNLDEKIKVMPHDFFTPQPVVGSRAYFFHAIIHDWEYDNAVKILKNTASAMKKGYSRLLICDIVIPPTGATATQCTMDLAIMLGLSARERTQADWEKLLSDCGLQIRKMWPDPRGFETLIEAELA